MEVVRDLCRKHITRPHKIQSSARRVARSHPKVNLHRKEEDTRRSVKLFYYHHLIDYACQCCCLTSICGSFWLSSAPPSHIHIASNSAHFSHIVWVFLPSLDLHVQYPSHAASHRHCGWGGMQTETQDFLRTEKPISKH